jgi:hypothetical protein
VEQGLPFSFPQKLKSFRLLGLFITGLERAYRDESRGGCIGEEDCFAVANSNVTDFSNSPSSLPTPERASVRPRFSRPLADAPLIEPQPVPRFPRTALGTTSHRYLSTVSLCSSVIGQLQPAALWSSQWRQNSLFRPVAL